MNEDRPRYAEDYFFVAECRVCDDDGMNCKTTKQSGIATSDRDPQCVLQDIEIKLLSMHGKATNVVVTTFNKV